jgi:SHS2 domain-containing protein
MPNKAQYRELEHTGDLAIEVTAPSREELLAQALIALARLMVEEEGIDAREHREISVRSESDADAMRDLLAAALNLFLIDSFIWNTAAVSTRDGAIVASLAGEIFDRNRHQLIGEIKAVTYHRLAVEETASGWRAVVVFDA